MKHAEQGWHCGLERSPPTIIYIIYNLTIYNAPLMWPRFDSRTRVICGLSLLLVLVSALRVFLCFFLPPQKPIFLNSNLTWNVRSRLKRAPRALWCSMGKLITFTCLLGPEEPFCDIKPDSFVFIICRTLATFQKQSNLTEQH